MSSLDVECRVLLVNWWLKDRVPRLIAPASQISSYDAETGELELINYWPAADGTSGFLAGDQIQIRHPDGRRWHGDDGGHIVDDAWEDNGDHFVRIYRRFITPPESGLIIELAEFDEYDNPWWPGADIYQNYDVVSRRYAYLADSLGRLGAADREADIYC